MNKEETSQNPPETKANKLLDTVLGDSGAMPTARMGIRSLAFVLDYIMINVVATFIIWKIAMPQTHPDAFSELNTWIQQVVVWFEKEGFRSETSPPEWSERLTAAMRYASNLIFIIFWLYFAAGEAFFAGRSLGKSICRLRSISTVTLERPPFVSAIVRGGLKTIALMWPIALVATIVALFFNKRRQTGHDLLSRTAVIDEKYINTLDNPL